ncbi:MAG: FmdB family zinc ribbon protein [Desulfobacterales bacterium]
MPVYDFYCADCGKEFVMQMRVAEYEQNKDRQKCPECGSSNVKRQVSVFEAQTSKKS